MNFGELDHKSREVIRIKAVNAIVNHGVSQVEIAKMFGVGTVSVCRWVKRYREGGKKGLRTKPIGRPSPAGKLKPLECAWIVKRITDKTPDQLKLPFYLWTRSAVGELIEKKFNVKLSKWTVGRMLRKWGLTPQKPAKKSYYQNNKKVKKWLKQEYPAIKTRASKENAVIHWLDEMGARSDDQVGRTYGRKGETPIVKVPGTRFSCNMIASISNTGLLEFMMFTETFKQDVFIKFLKQLVKKKKRKIFLIVDGHPSHKGKRVKDWLKENNKRIEIIFLPSYSPELNPAEYLNQDTKSNAVRRKKAMNQKELVNNIASFLEAKKQNPKSVRAYFKAKYVKYAA